MYWTGLFTAGLHEYAHIFTVNNISGKDLANINLSLLGKLTNLDELLKK